MKNYKLVRSLILIALLACSVQAASFSYVAVFGDSLSDNGNLYAFSGGAFPPSPPYYAGRVSNGPVAVEYMAGILGSPLLDYAFAGATTGIGNTLDDGSASAVGTAGLPGVTTVYGLVRPGLPILPDALYVVWGGPNDMIAALANPPTIPGAIGTAVGNLDAIIIDLLAGGAQHILVPGMPDLGLTPRVRALGAGAQAGASATTQAFNQALQGSLPPGVTFYDTAAFLAAIVNDPAAFGFSNATDACFTGSTICADPSKYLFWDDIHPTTAGHALLGGQFADAVPEPATAALALIGIIVGLARRRKRSVC